MLVQRYFTTFHLISPVLDEATFYNNLDAILNKPQKSPIHLLVQVMLVLALANGTYTSDQAPIPQSTAFVWSDLASSIPTTALELSECTLDILRVAALLITAKQTLKFNDTSDYVYSGAGIRLAMILGLNRTHNLGTDGGQVWQTVRELDLHACLGCGTAPTLPLGDDLAFASTSLASTPTEQHSNERNEILGKELTNDELLRILQRSLHIRTKIVALVSGEHHLKFVDVMSLSHDLAREMSSISDHRKRNTLRSSFVYEYPSYTIGSWQHYIGHSQRFTIRPSTCLVRSRNVGRGVISRESVLHSKNELAKPFRSITC